MDRWRGRLAVVTGGSAGIGSAITYQLLDAGVDVVALARRSEAIKNAVDAARKGAESRGRKNAKAPLQGRLHCIKCDVSNEEDIIKAFKWIQGNTKGVDILINNAGICRTTALSESNTADWKGMLDTNVLGLSICSREALQQMKARGVDDGHIIHIGSIAGHKNPTLPTLSMYYATKHAVRVLTEGLRKELVAAQSKIRVSEVSPGLVKTEIADHMNIPKDVLFSRVHLHPEDIADAVLYVLGVPPHVQIHEIIVKPVGEEG